MNTPAIFSFKSNDVRTVMVDGAIWFIATDIAKAVGYRSADDMTRVLDEDERGTHNMRTPSGDQSMIVINESGLYHVLLKSRRPEAKPFRKWVTHEVLPTIRKTGRYESALPSLPSSVSELPDPLHDASYRHAALQVACNYIDACRTAMRAAGAQLPPWPELDEKLINGLVMGMLRTQRFTFSFAGDGQIDLRPIPSDALVVSPRNADSLECLIDERVPLALLPDLIRLCLNRLSKFAENQGRDHAQ